MQDAAYPTSVYDEMRANNFAEITRMLVEEAMPFYKLWVQIEKEYTSGDGFLDKLCMELIYMDRL